MKTKVRILFSLLLIVSSLVPSFALETTLTIMQTAASGNTLNDKPVTWICDGNEDTAWGVDLTNTSPADSSAWAELSLAENSFIYGVEISSYLSPGTTLTVCYESNGLVQTFTGAQFTGLQGAGQFLPLSFDQAVTPKIILKLTGGTGLSRISEVKVKGKPVANMLNKIIPVSLTASDNTSFFATEDLLVDGLVRSYWRTKPDLDWDDLKKEVHQALTQEYGYKHNLTQTDNLSTGEVVFNLGQTHSLENIRLYLTPKAHGDIYLYAFNGSEWVALASLPEAGYGTGWQDIALADCQTDQIKLFVSGTDGMLGGIGEVEFWGYGTVTGNQTLEICPNKVNLLSPLNLSFVLESPAEYELEIALSCTSGPYEGALNFKLNGKSYSLTAPQTVYNTQVFRKKITRERFWSGTNFLHIDALDETLTVEAIRLRNVEDSGQIDMSFGAVSDRLYFTPAALTEETIFDLGQSVYLKYLEVFASPSTGVGMFAYQDGVWSEMTLNDQTEYSLTFTGPFVTNKLKIVKPGNVNIGEIRLAGSPTLDMAPHVTILWPRHEDCLNFPATRYGFLFGWVDNPEAQVTVNGLTAQQQDHYFWIKLTDLGLSESNYYELTARAVDAQNREGSHTIAVFTNGLLNLTVNLSEEILYTTGTTVNISGQFTPGFEVKVNGEPALLNSSTYSKTVALEEGFNLLHIALIHKNSQKIVKSLFRKVVRLSGNLNLTIDTPAPSTYTNKSVIRVSGSVNSTGSVNITVNGVPALQKGNIYWLDNLALQEGDNAVIVTATDSFGRTATKELLVRRDTGLPVLSNLLPVPDSILAVGSFPVTGTVSDASPWWVYVEGTLAAKTQENFQQTVTFPDGFPVIHLVAVDAAGNKTEYNFALTVDTTPPGAFVPVAEPGGWTNNNQPVLTFFATDATSGIGHYELKVDEEPFTSVLSPFTLLPQADGIHTITVKAVDKAGWSTLGETKIYIDTVAPHTPFLRAVSGNTRITMKWMNVSDDEDIVAYTLNRNPAWLEPFDNTAAFEYLDVGLINGTTYQYQVIAIDRAGNTSPASEWITAVPGRGAGNYASDKGAIVEYENLQLFIPAQALPATVKEVRVEEIISPDLAEQAVYPIVGPIYHFSVMVEENGVLVENESILFEKEYIGRITYNPEQIPAEFPEQNLDMYYFDPMWGKWFKVPHSGVDIDNNSLYFSTNHFSSFSAQPTMLEDISPQEIQDAGYSPFKTDIKHEGMTVSPQGGTAMTEATELVLPGKNGFNFELKRNYDSATARGDAIGLSISASIGIPIGASPDFSGIVNGVINSLTSTAEDTIKRYFKNNGDYAYTMGTGWRLNLPYIRSANSTVLVRLPSGSFYSISQMQITELENILGVGRCLVLENHETEDFTLKITQVRQEFSVVSLISGQNLIPGWTLVAAELILKDGTHYFMDMLGRTTRIVDAQGLNQIDIYYNGLVLEHIVDSMGRKIHFEYQDTYFVIPKIKKIYVEDDNREINYNTSYFPSYLNSSTDVNGRQWNYEYSNYFLTSGGLSVKINIISFIGDIIATVCSFGSAGGKVSEFMGIDAITISGHIQWEYVNLITKVYGPGIGITKVHYKIETYDYVDVSAADYFLGFIPTAVLFKWEAIKRIFADKVEVYLEDNISPVKTTSYTYTARYIGDDQFLIEKTEVNDGKTITVFGYQDIKKTRCRWVDLLDGLLTQIGNNLINNLTQGEFNLSFLFMESPYYKDHLAVNTSITIYDNYYNFIEKTESQYDSATLRLKTQKVWRSATNYRHIVYNYDSWGNPISITNSSQTGERTNSVIEYMYYHNSGSTPDVIFNSFPNPYGTINLDIDFIVGPWRSEQSQYIHNLLIGKAVVNVLPAELNQSPITSCTYNYYNSLAQLAASSIWTGTGWAETTYTYHPEHGSVISIVNPLGHRTTVDYDYNTVLHPQNYYIARTEEDVRDADGNVSDITTVSGHQWVTGYKLWEMNPRGFVTEYLYDKLGRTIKITEPDDDPGEISWDPRINPIRPNNSNNPVTQIQYNDTELWSRVLNPKQAAIKYDYDNLGRLVKIDKSLDDNPAYSTTEIQYDAWNNITAITDANGHTTNYEYDCMNRTAKIIHPLENDYRAEKVMNFDYANNQSHNINENRAYSIESYDMQNRIIKSVLYNNLDTLVTEIYYDGLGNQVLVVDPKGNKTVSRFDERNLLNETALPVESVWENGVLVEHRPVVGYEYDLAGQKIAEILGSTLDTQTRRTDYQVDGLGRIYQITNYYTSDEEPALTQTTRQQIYYDAKGNKIRLLDGKNTDLKAAGETYYCTEYSYSARDKVLTEVNSVAVHLDGTKTGGNITGFTYDILGNQLSLTDPRGNSSHYPASYKDYFTIDYQYDDLNRLVKATMPVYPGSALVKPEVRFTYDARGNLLERLEADGGKTLYTYTPRNKVQTETVTGTEATVSYTVTHVYDSVGNEKETIDNSGQKTVNLYDDLNRLLRITHPAGNFEIFEYDKQGNKISETDGKTNKTSYIYSPSKKLLKQTDALNGEIQFFYDRWGNLVRHIDANGLVTTYVYDELNRKITETNALGHSYTYTYDKAGNIIESLDPNRTQSIYTYTPNNLVDAITLTNGGSVQTISYTYDEAGDKITATNGDIVLSYNTFNGSYIPDPFSRIHRESRSLEGKTYSVDYDYDIMGRNTRTGYPAGYSVNYTYNNLGQLTAVPGFIDSSPAYDNRGLLSSLSAANGMVADFTYDVNTRLTNLSYSDAASAELKAYALFYDAANNIIKQNNNQYFYDKLNRLIVAELRGKFNVLKADEKQTSGLAEADLDGERQLAFTLSDSEVIQLDYNARSIGVDLGQAYWISRLVLKPLALTDRLNADKLNIFVSQYNINDTYTEITGWELVRLEDNTIELRLTEPVRGRYIKVHCHYNERNEENTAESKATVQNQADAILRVFYMIESRLEEYSYDPKGNRLTSAVTLKEREEKSYTYYPNSDRLKSDSKFGYAYDANGNLIAKGTVFTEQPDGGLLFDKTNGEYWEYQYDLLNRMVAVYKNEALVCSYSYDEKGYRVKRDSVSQGVSYYVFGLDGQVLYQEELKKGNYYEYVYVNGKHFARVEGQLGGDGSERQKLFYALDHLGSTTMITDEEGRVVWQDEATPFGESSGQVGVLDESIKFTGKDLDREINLHYFNARWYSADIGRFTTVDPIKDGVNWYVYCSNSPLVRIDPTGLGDYIFGTAARVLDPDQQQTGAAIFQVVKNVPPPSLALAVLKIGGWGLVLGTTATLQGSVPPRAATLSNGQRIYESDLPEGWSISYENRYFQLGPVKIRTGADAYLENANSGARYKAAQLSINENGEVLGPSLPAGYSYDQNGQIIAPDGNVMPSIEAAEAHSQGLMNWNNFTNGRAKINFSEKQLQKKFKHAGDFGITGNYNKQNASKYQEALQNFINDPNTKTIEGTYRGESVTHYLNPETRQNVIVDSQGSFRSAWKLNEDQLKYVQETGNLGGD